MYAYVEGPLGGWGNGVGWGVEMLAHVHPVLLPVYRKLQESLHPWKVMGETIAFGQPSHQLRFAQRANGQQDHGAMHLQGSREEGQYVPRGIRHGAHVFTLCKPRELKTMYVLSEVPPTLRRLLDTGFALLAEPCKNNQKSSHGMRSIK